MTHIDSLDAHKNKTFLLKQFFMKIKTRIGNLQNMGFLTIQQENCHISLIWPLIEKNNGTFFSSTLKVRGKKVPLFFSF